MQMNHVTCVSLFVPLDMNVFCEMMEKEMNECYESVVVEAVLSPPLTEEPFGLAKARLSGSQRIICDVGSVMNVEKVRNCGKKKWKMDDVARFVGVGDGIIIGAAANSPECGAREDNAELIPNTGVVDCNRSKEAFVNVEGTCSLVDYESSEFAGLGNFFISTSDVDEEVIHIRAEVRISEEKSFITNIRKALIKLYPEEQVGLGGVFVVESGSIKSHVMPCFPPSDLESKEQVDEWLNFYEVDAPATCLSVLVSQEFDGFPLELRLEHTHFFTNRQDGGHYHYDLTPETVVYNGYFSFASQLYRIDPSIQFSMPTRDEPESDIVFL